MTEAQFTKLVIDLAHLFGWWCVHIRPARTKKGWRTPVQGDGKGFLDTVLVHPVHGVLWRELKTDTGKVSPEQEQWLNLLREAGEDADVWRPSDWNDIEATLRGEK